MQTKETIVSLETLARGAVIESFEVQLQKVLKNIVDPNTNPVAARSLTIKLVFKPDFNRESATMHIHADSKLAPEMPVTTAIYIEEKAIDRVKQQRSPTLQDAISTWAGNCAQHWSAEQLTIVEKLVTDLLTQITDSDCSVTEESFVSVVNIERAPKGVFPLAAEVFSAEIELRNAIERWGNQQSADWAKDARLESVVSSVEKVLKQYTLNKLGVFEALLGQTGIYRVPHPEESLELEQVCRLQNWDRFVEVVEQKESVFKLSVPSRTTIIDRAVSVMIVQHSRHVDQIKTFQKLQSDVIGYLRALALIIESAANGGTHAEKDARFRGVISLLETSIDKVRRAHETFVSSHWWNSPDLFRSDYPVRPLLDRVHELEDELKKLKGEASANSEANAEIPDDLIF